MSILVPHLIKERPMLLKQYNIRLLQTEIIERENFEIDGSFMNLPQIDYKVKKILGNVHLQGYWCEIPEWLKDVEITGYFSCSDNKLTSLKNCPKVIGGFFDCADNYLTDLVGTPSYIGGSIYCSINQLTSLEGCPKIVHGDFRCSNNKLSSLKGCPEIIYGSFECSDNQLADLENGPKYVKDFYKADFNILRGYIENDK